MYTFIQQTYDVMIHYDTRTIFAIVIIPVLLIYTYVQFNESAPD